MKVDQLFGRAMPREQDLGAILVDELQFDRVVVVLCPGSIDRVVLCPGSVDRVVLCLGSVDRALLCPGAVDVAVRCIGSVQKTAIRPRVVAGQVYVVSKASHTRWVKLLVDLSFDA